MSMLLLWRVFILITITVAHLYILTLFLIILPLFLNPRQLPFFFPLLIKFLVVFSEYRDFDIASFLYENDAIVEMATNQTYT